MKCYDFDWQINEFMIYCRSTQLRERTMYSYEQTLRLVERWCADELRIYRIAQEPVTLVLEYPNPSPHCSAVLMQGSVGPKE